MKWASLAACALGGVLLLAAGCKSLDLDLGFAGPDGAGTVRVVDGAPETVAVSLRDTLKKRGLDAVISQSSDGTVLVECQAPAGVKFGLLLNSMRTSDGREQTHVALVSGTDHGAGVQLLADIDRQTKK